MIIIPEILDDMAISPKALRAYVELLFNATCDSETFTTACYRWDHDITSTTLSGIHTELYQRGMVSQDFKPLPPEHWEWRYAPNNNHPLTVGLFALEIQPIELDIDTPTFRLWLHAIRMAQTQRSTPAWQDTSALCQRLGITYRELINARTTLTMRDLLPTIDDAIQTEE